MRIPLRRMAVLLGISAIAWVSVPAPHDADASANYGYDTLGRLTTALYDNGLCVVYAYDPNGNRTSQNNTTGSAPETPTWGTGTWGCFAW